MYRDLFGVPLRNIDKRVFEISNFGVTAGDGVPRTFDQIIPRWPNRRIKPVVGAYFKNAEYAIHLASLPVRTSAPPKPCCCMYTFCKIEVVFWIIGIATAAVFLTFCGWKYREVYYDDLL
uniref:Uncharacterized protein n=1 Tax=Caenorhabditis japonica TaxID=281687 RepID=A0A8R1DW05_CAEJA